MKPGLEFFPVDVEVSAETVDGMVLVKVHIEILPDLFDLLGIFSFAAGASITMLSTGHLIEFVTIEDKKK